jgi:hypothetical protein
VGEGGAEDQRGGRGSSSQEDGIEVVKTHFLERNGNHSYHPTQLTAGYLQSSLQPLLHIHLHLKKACLSIHTGMPALLW